MKKSTAYTQAAITIAIGISPNSLPWPMNGYQSGNPDTGRPAVSTSAVPCAMPSVASVTTKEGMPK